MSILKKNIVANLLGRGWSGLISLGFIPIYIKFLGIESYGLIGVFIMIQAFISVLDLGLSATVNREMARLSACSGKLREMRDLLRTMECAYLVVALIVGALVFAVAPLISRYWINPEQLSSGTVFETVILMGAALAVQWPGTLYSGGLMGLQKQVLLSGTTAFFSTARAAGAALILWLLTPTIQAFFMWQVAISLIQTAVLGFLLWNQLEKTKERPRFKKDIFFEIWRFAAGMSGISLMAIVAMQLDKVILSKVLSLENFGYYTLASTAAATLYFIVGPFFSAMFPKFSQLVELKKIAEVKQLYHRGSQFLAVILFPIMSMAIFFSYDILFAWTNDHLIASNASLILPILIIGNALNGLMNVPYAVQLAYGWVKIPLYTNLAGLVFLIPSVLVGASLYDGVGAASAWALFNILYFCITVWLMEKLVFKEGVSAFLINDVGIPLLAVLVTVGLLKSCLVDLGLLPGSLIWMTCVFLLACASGLLSAPHIRLEAKRVLNDTRELRRSGNGD